MNQSASDITPQWLIDATKAAREEQRRWRTSDSPWTPWDDLAWQTQAQCIEIVRAAVPFILDGHLKENPHDRMDA